MVLKIFENDRLKTEVETLRMARRSGIAVPGVVDVADRALLMDLVPGRTVNEYLETPEMGDKVLAVAGWLAAFHAAFRAGDTVCVRSDAILRNFIVADRVYGIDFELAHRGSPEEDVGETLAYLLDTDPMFSGEKFALGKRFISRYEKESGIPLKNIDSFIGRSLREAARFRPRQSPLLMDWAGEIEASYPFTPSRR